MDIRLCLDRIESDRAVLISEDEQTVDWPVSLLPANARESDILSFTVLVDETATSEARQEAAELLQQLTKKQL